MMQHPVHQLPLTRLARFKAAFKHRFFLRFHMTLILLGVFSSGLILSKLLLKAGVGSMIIRYLITLVLSYLMFFLFIRLWLFYIRRISPAASSDTGLADVLFIPDGGSVSAGGTADLVSPGGGEFGGGGASGDFADSSPASGVSEAAHSAIPAAVAPQSGESSSLDIDLDGGGIALVILGILLALILGAGLYLVYAAPVILADTAVQALMASSLYRASKRMDSPDWMGSIFKATWIPFAVVAFLTITVALVTTHYCPDASKLSEALRELWTTGRSR